MSEAERLLPCPFCGGEAEVERVGDYRQSHIIACTECGCRLETGEDAEWNRGNAWNTRAQSARMAALEDALREVHDDLIMRAEFEGDEKIVAVGTGVWVKVCNTLAATAPLTATTTVLKHGRDKALGKGSE